MNNKKPGIILVNMFSNLEAIIANLKEKKAIKGLNKTKDPLILTLNFFSFTIFFILNILKINLRDNLVVFLILFLITPQYHIFHKYYDPLVFILFLTMINFNLGKNFFIKKRKGFPIIFYKMFFVKFLRIKKR